SNRQASDRALRQAARAQRDLAWRGRSLRLDVDRRRRRDRGHRASRRARVAGRWRARRRSGVPLRRRLARREQLGHAAGASTTAADQKEMMARSRLLLVTLAALVTAPTSACSRPSDEQPSPTHEQRDQPPERAPARTASEAAELIRPDGT